MNSHRFLPLFVTLILTISCMPQEQGIIVKCFTETASQISAVSFEIGGSASVSGTEQFQAEAYFYYSDVESESSRIRQEGKRVNCRQITTNDLAFKTILGNLEYETKYSYIAAVSFGGNEYLGSVQSFTTGNKPAALCVTGDATNVTEISAVVNGYSNITGEGLGSYSVGFVYSTNPDPNLSNGFSKTSKEFVSQNQFVATLTGLKPATTYYYRSFILRGGTYLYGAIASFTTNAIQARLETQGVEDVAEHSVTLKGKLTLENSTSLSTSVAFYYGANMTSLDDLKTKGTKVSTTLSSNGLFSKSLSNLPHSSSYAYVAYANVAGVDFWGELKTFSTSPINVSVQTVAASDISEHKATVTGSYTLLGNSTQTPKAYLYYSNTSSDRDGILANGKRISISSIPSNGKFSSALTGLNPATKYYYLAHVQLEGVDFYGEILSFNTLSINAYAETVSASDISEHKATLSGKFVKNTVESLSVSNLSIIYSDAASTKDALIQSGKKLSITKQNSDGSFSFALSSLSPATKYYYMTYAKIENAEFTGAVKNFTTRAISATASTGSASSVSEHKATIAGSFSRNTVEEITPEVFVYYSSTAKTVEQLRASGTSVKITGVSSTGGQFTKELTGLSTSTTYYYVVDVKLEGQYFSGSVKSFSTPKINASVKTESATGIKYHDATLNGTVTINTIETLPYQCGFYYSNSVSTASALKQSGTKISVNTLGSNNYSAAITGDDSHRTYYFMSYLEIDGIEFFGSVSSLRMKDVPNGLVDLGLSVLWAKCNLGASSPEGTGGFYAWGEIKEKESYSKSTYNSTIAVKYASGENLDKAEDVAYLSLGDHYRIPSMDSINELYNNTIIKETHINQTKGFLFTSTKPGFTQSIFIPCCGEKEDNIVKHNDECYTRTSTCADFEGAYCMRLVPGYINSLFPNYVGSWYYGMQIRPVYDLEY